MYILGQVTTTIIIKAALCWQIPGVTGFLDLELGVYFILV